ncbi:eppin-like [Crassostrea angulata]|uniref:eppin-like n=1 Tax=Magallana angulata TaxID=2784310 RepID=UPI0022B1CED4|nr:eppin-like [Crassostrea angulata]
MGVKLLVLCFIVSACAVRRPPPPPPPPGPPMPFVCPASKIITTCDCRPELNRCNVDSDCPGGQKCCDQGCGCRRRCVNPVLKPGRPGKPNTCYEPKEVGLCRAAIRRWWYNEQTKQCETFNYGGSGGNGHNYKTKRQCEQRCKTRKHDRKLLRTGRSRKKAWR